MQLADADRDLDELRAPPVRLAQIDQLVEQYCGSRRLSLSAADTLLGELGAQQASDWAARAVHVRSSWPPDSPENPAARPRSSSPPNGSFASPIPPGGAANVRPSARFHKSPTLTGLGVASSVPPPEPEPNQPNPKTFSAPGGGFAPYDEDEETVPAAESPSAMLNGAVSAWSRSWSSAPAAPEVEGASSRPPTPPSAFGSDRPRSLTPSGVSSRPPARQFSSRPPLTAAEVPPIFELPEPKDGPLTQRMSARELRGSGRPFNSGLVGAEDLPEFPGRTPQPARTFEKPGATPAPQAANSQNLAEPQDNFEILVDEEILEIEPDDPLIEEIEG